MRKFSIVIVAALLAASVAGTAFATSVKVIKSARRVTFRVENTTKSPLICDGKLVAKTKSGKFLEAFMKKETVKPGAENELYLTADDAAADPFVDGWSNIACTEVPAAPAPPADPED